MDNVIDFQGIKAKKEQQRFDELVEEMDEHEFSIEQFGLEAVHEIIDVLTEDFGCDVYTDAKTIHDIISIVEHIKSLSYRALGQEYPLQTYTDLMLEPVIEDPKKMLYLFMTGEYNENDLDN